MKIIKRKEIEPIKKIVKLRTRKLKERERWRRGKLKGGKNEWKKV